NAYKEFREFYWKRFRYHVIFFVNEKDKEVVIFSLYHASRGPGNKFLGLYFIRNAQCLQTSRCWGVLRNFGILPSTALLIKYTSS
ncbi:MAG: hypothetical protein ACRDE2_05880, partial [Chitinophagaceae bacterium]